MILPIAYPYTLERDRAGYYVARFVQFPQATARAPSIDALAPLLEDALIGGLMAHLTAGLLPEARRAHAGECLHTLSVSHATKLQFIGLMKHHKVSHRRLAAHLGVRYQEVTRLMDLTHNTKIDALVEAIEALGGKVSMTVEITESVPCLENDDTLGL